MSNWNPEVPPIDPINEDRNVVPRAAEFEDALAKGADTFFASMEAEWSAARDKEELISKWTEGLDPEVQDEIMDEYSQIADKAPGELNSNLTILSKLFAKIKAEQDAADRDKIPA